MVHVYAVAHAGEELVCELCRPLRTAEPDRSARALARAARGAVTSARPAPVRSGRLDPVTVSVTIDRPREEVFDYLADIANHSEFMEPFWTGG